MKIYNRNKSQEKHTLTDRFAVAFLSAVFSFITGLIIWFLFVVAYEFKGPYIFSSFKLVYGFTVIMSFLGFLRVENFLATIFGHLWHAIYNHLRY